MSFKLARLRADSFHERSTTKARNAAAPWQRDDRNRTADWRIFTKPCLIQRITSAADSIMLQKTRNVAAALDRHGVTAILRLVNVSLAQDLLPGRCGRFDSNMSMVPVNLTNHFHFPIGLWLSLSHSWFKSVPKDETCCGCSLAGGGGGEKERRLLTGDYFVIPIYLSLTHCTHS